MCCFVFVLFSLFPHKYSLNKKNIWRAKRKSKAYSIVLISANGYFNGMSLVEFHVVQMKLNTKAQMRKKDQIYFAFCGKNDEKKQSTHAHTQNESVALFLIQIQ